MSTKPVIRVPTSGFWVLVLLSGTAWADCTSGQLSKMIEVGVEDVKIRTVCDFESNYCSLEHINAMQVIGMDKSRIRNVCGLKQSNCTPTQIGKMKDVGVDEVKIDEICRSQDVAPAQNNMENANKEASPPNKAPRTKSKPPVHTVSESRMLQKHGLGLGQSLGSSLGIIHLFYDYNLSEMTQLHVQIGRTLNFDSTSGYYSTYGYVDAEATRDYLLATHRWFLGDNLGWYAGTGLGFSYNRFEYSGSRVGTIYNSRGKGVYGLAEVGWQGNTGYYFHVGFQPGLYFYYDDEFDINQIPDISNHRDTSSEIWRFSKRPSQIAIGFGWFF